MSALHLPNQAAATHLLQELLCKPVATKPAVAPLGASPAPRVVAVYVTDTGAVGSVCLCDIMAAAYLGAALSLIAPAVATEALKTGRLSEGLLENLREVVNVGASLFNVTGGAHVRFKDLLVPPRALPPEIVAIVNSKKSRLDLDITIPGYGVGKLSFVLA